MAAVGRRGRVTWLLRADVSPWWDMRGVRVGSFLSLCSDIVVSMSQYPQQAGAAERGGGPGTRGWGQRLPRRGEGFLGPWKVAGALHWSCPPDTTPPEEGRGSPEDPKTQTQQRPDTACFIARLSQPLTELGENAQIINNLTYNK